jgi:hypothetical protein
LAAGFGNAGEPPAPSPVSSAGEEEEERAFLPITPSIPFYLFKSPPTLCFLSNKTLSFMVITNKASTI